MHCINYNNVSKMLVLYECNCLRPQYSVHCAVKLLSAVIVGQGLKSRWYNLAICIVTSSLITDPILPSNTCALSQLPHFPQNMLLYCERMCM